MGIPVDDPQRGAHYGVLSPAGGAGAGTGFAGGAQLSEDPPRTGIVEPTEISKILAFPYVDHPHHFGRIAA